LLAPQANLMASVALGIFGGELPWGMIGIGILLGAAIIAIDETLKRRGSGFRTPVLACAVGIYLPIELSVPIFTGGLVSYLVERRLKPGKAEGERERIHQKGTLFAAGLITGEALMGIFMAIPIVALGAPEVLALPEKYHLGSGIGLLSLGGVAWLLYRLAVRQETLGRS
jgi:putative OPT family oligopeptide transporter